MDSMNNWKKIWEKKEADSEVLSHGSTEDIVMELKRISGFDVLEDAIKFSTFYQQCEEVLKNLGGAGTISSIYEVGCGGGANLYLYEQQGIQTGGIDYSASMIKSAKRVLKTGDLVCDEAKNLSTIKKYDAIFSNSVFSYFADEEYAWEVLQKMYEKANYSIGLIDIHDVEKREAFEAYRRANVEEYEERYRDLPKFFYRRDFFTEFAKEYNLKVSFADSNVEGYWNNEFVYSCYFYKNQHLT